MNLLIWMVPLALLITVLLIRRIRAAAEKQYTRKVVKKRLKNLDMYYVPARDDLALFAAGGHIPAGSVLIVDKVGQAMAWLSSKPKP